jgi:hypothetical protein
MLAAIIFACRHDLQLRTLDSNTSSGGEAITSSDLLQVALHLPAIAFPAVLAFIELLHQGVISDRAAVHCLSDLRLHLQERASSLDYTPVSSADIILRDEFLEIAHTCMACIRHMSSTTHSTRLFSTSMVNDAEDDNCDDCPEDKDQYKYTSSVSLELLPYLVELLVDISEEAAEEIINTLLQKQWPSSLLLTLCNSVCDLLSFLSARHLAAFKVPHHHHDHAPLCACH